MSNKAPEIDPGNEATARVAPTLREPARGPGHDGHDDLRAAITDAGPVRPAAIRTLQGAAGNRAVARLIQTKTDAATTIEGNGPVQQASGYRMRQGGLLAQRQMTPSVSPMPAGAAVIQRQEEHWAKATYPTPKACMDDHFRRHPSEEWDSVQAYTDKAIEVLKANYNYAREITLKDGSKGWKITTRDYFGIYTNDDKIVTFGEK